MRRLSMMLMICVGLVGCSTLSIQEEKRLGHEVQRQVREELQLMRDPVVVNYVRDIGDKLATSARPSPFEFRFYVVEDESINAFAVPGGAIYVHTGLLMAAKNVAEVAGVLSHEIGHVTARHVAKQYRRQRNTGIGAQVVAILVAILAGDPYLARGGQVLTGVAAQAYINTYTQDAEREADALAVETMANAGYDGYALVTMFQTLQEEAGGGAGVPQFLLSHPATAERIQNVSRMIDQRGKPPGAIREDRKLPIIQERIELIIGTDIETEAEFQ